MRVGGAGGERGVECWVMVVVAETEPEGLRVVFVVEGVPEIGWELKGGSKGFVLPEG